MLELPQDRIARREEAETAHAIMRADEKRAADAKISLALAAFEIAVRAEPADLIRARHDFKTAQIALGAYAHNLPPGDARRWVMAFLHISGVWSNPEVTRADRELAADMCALLAKQIRAARRI